MSKRVGPMNIRLRGKVGQIEDDPEKPERNGKWCFEISVWNLAGTEQVGETLFFAPWETEEIAHTEMNRAIKISCEAIQEKVGGPVGEYFDMLKGGALRNFSEQEH